MQDLRVLFDTAADTDYQAQLADAKSRRLGVAVPFTPFLAAGETPALPGKNAPGEARRTRSRAENKRLCAA